MCHVDKPGFFAKFKECDNMIKPWESQEPTQLEGKKAEDGATWRLKN